MAVSLALLVLPSCSHEGAAVGALAVSRTSLILPFPERTDLTVSWTPQHRLQNLEPPLRVFVHLRGAGGEILRTFDHPFPAPWEPGRVVQYDVALFQSALGPPLPPGSYDLTMGLYDAAGRRWAVNAPGELVARDEYRVAAVVVPMAMPPVPHFVADAGWGLVEAGGGAQILGRRWLTRSGHMALQGIQSDGSVWMRLIVAAASGESQQLVLDPGADQQAVRISTSCGPGEEYLTGGGPHEVRLAIELEGHDSAQQPCDIRFDANFQVVDLETLKRRVLQLEILSWIPSSADLDTSSEAVTEESPGSTDDEPTSESE